MTGMEVLTAADYKLPVIWVILKNNRLGAIHDVQELSYQGRIAASKFSEVDFVAIGKSFGAEAYQVNRPEEIKKVLEKALKASRPVIIEAIIDPDEKFPLTRRSLALKDSVGLPKLMKSISTDSVKALIKMFKNQEV